MAIKNLTEEQIRTWSLEQKDRWWLENVYKGDMPQLTLRAAVMGFVLGGLLSATNLYIGAKTGWSLGVGITSVILAFAFFKTLQRTGLVGHFSILENNCVQSIATSAGYMTAPLISSLVAYMVISDRVLPWHQIMLWNVVTSMLGVLFAFPMKRRFINEEQHPFPEGRACGVVLDTLHESDGGEGLRKARILGLTALTAGVIKFTQAEAIQEWLQHRVLKLKTDVLYFPEQLDVLAVKMGIPVPRIANIDIRQLTITPALDLALIGAGGLMGIRAATSLIIGAMLNYLVLAPWMAVRGDIPPVSGTIAGGDAVFGFRQITVWSLWPGVACMVAASMVAFFAKPRLLLSAFKVLSGSKRSAAASDPLAGIEFPLWISIIGIPVMSVVTALLGHQFFGVPVWAGLIGLPLTFILAMVAANSTALTGTTPVGATSKITQLFYGAVRPGDITTNIATASITAEVVSNASNLLMDIKPGYMLGAKPRQQAIGHVIGILSGALASTPLFYLLFTQEVEEKGVGSIQSDKFPMPAATVWEAVAKVLTQGISQLPTSVVWAVGVAVLVGIAFEVSRIVTRGRFPLSPVAMGLAFVINFQYSLAFFMGALFFWAMGVGRRREGEPSNVFVENHEPMCAGLITGAALVGIADAVVTAFLLK